VPADSRRLTGVARSEMPHIAKNIHLSRGEPRWRRRGGLMAAGIWTDRRHHPVVGGKHVPEVERQGWTKDTLAQVEQGSGGERGDGPPLPSRALYR
jgi:hypothetical protein